MGALAQALIAKGYNPTDAANAENGPRAAELAREYLGSSGGSSGGTDGFISPEDYANKLLDAQKKQIDEETKFLDDYSKTNPFIFDEELAKKSATAEYEPYYSELLKDYTADIDLKRQSVQDEAQLLTKLKSMDDASRSRSYQQAVSRANEGFAGSGMFFSGDRARGVGEMAVDYTSGQKRAEEGYGAQQRGNERQITALDTDLSQKTRDIGREKQAVIESGVLTRESEAQKQYYAPLEQSYYRKFPSASGGALRGYTLPEYYRV
jgi:hypothetical protein